MPIRSRRFRFTSAISLLAAMLASGCAHAQAERVADLLRGLDAGTAWERRSELPLQFDTHHPQDMTRVDDRAFLSSVEVLNRAEGRGVGHLFEFDAQGKAVRGLELAEGPIYHPGGIDYDGESIWLPLAEYRPDSQSIVYRIEPDTFEAEAVFRVPDHLGAIAHLPDQGLLVAVNWGSRQFYEWDTRRGDNGWQPVDPDSPRVIDNPSHYIAYQDLQHVPGTSFTIASGVRKLRAPSRTVPLLQLGGLDLLEFPGGALRHGLPLNLATETRVPMSQNAFYVDAAANEFRLWFIPEDNRSTLYIYAPRQK